MPTILKWYHMEALPYGYVILSYMVTSTMFVNTCQLFGKGTIKYMEMLPCMDLLLYMVTEPPMFTLYARKHYHVRSSVPNCYYSYVSRFYI